jgi:transcriptional regulator with XRE-family HTH domain
VFDPESFELAVRMPEIRMRQGLRQAEVARVGLDPSMPSLWERGKRPVTRNRVPALAPWRRLSASPERRRR